MMMMLCTLPLVTKWKSDFSLRGNGMWKSSRAVSWNKDSSKYENVEMHDFILIVLTNRNYQTKSKTHEEIEDWEIF